MSKAKIKSFAELQATLYKPKLHDASLLARQCDDIALEIHDLGNRLHRAGLHRQGTAADVAAGMIEELMEDLNNGG
jgi:hypothetical protein